MTELTINGLPVDMAAADKAFTDWTQTTAFVGKGEPYEPDDDDIAVDDNPEFADATPVTDPAPESTGQEAAPAGDSVPKASSEAGSGTLTR